LGHAGKSGPTYAQRYRLTNQIDHDNVFEPAALAGAIRDRHPRALVFVDDFVGSGASVEESVASLPDGLVRAIGEEKMLVGFACVAGFTDGLQRVQNAFRERGILRARINAGDLLDMSNRCFAEQSQFFSAEVDRVNAEQIAAKLGRQLEPLHPLGFHDTQAAVVFETRCPNNSLPILWSGNPNWRPLFPRH
jgi:hypothetical protein